MNIVEGGCYHGGLGFVEWFKRGRDGRATMWTGQVGDTTLTLIHTGNGGRAWYELYATTDGAWWLAGTYAVYPQALTAIQSWQEYLRVGGTVEAWVRQSLPQQGPRELR